MISRRQETDHFAQVLVLCLEAFLLFFIVTGSLADSKVLIESGGSVQASYKMVMFHISFNFRNSKAFSTNFSW